MWVCVCVCLCVCCPAGFRDYQAVLRLSWRNGDYDTKRTVKHFDTLDKITQVLNMEGRRNRYHSLAAVWPWHTFFCLKEKWEWGGFRVNRKSVIWWCHSIFSFLKNHVDFSGQFMSRMFPVLVDSLQMVGGENDCKHHRIKDDCRTQRNSCHLLSAGHLKVYNLMHVSRTDSPIYTPHMASFSMSPQFSLVFPVLPV